MAEVKILSLEDREKLFGLAPFSRTATSWYTPKQFSKLSEHLRPSFEIRPLTVQEKKEAENLLTAGKDMDQNKLMELARGIILGWKQYYDAGTGELLECKKDGEDKIEKGLFDDLPSLVVSDILTHAIKIAGLLDPEKLGLKS